MIFGKYARRYFEQGFPVFPATQGEKGTFVSGWNEFSKMLPTERIFSIWEREYSECNIAMAMGPTSAWAFDLDTNNPKILEIVSEYTKTCDDFTRVGSKGFGIFFQYEKQFEQVKKKKSAFKDCWDLKLSNSYMLVAPSVFNCPKTNKSYTYKDTLEVLSDAQPHNLPFFKGGLAALEDMLARIEQFAALSGEFSATMGANGLTPGAGRWNSLSAYVWQSLHSLTPTETISAVLRYDEWKHLAHVEGPWFRDNTQPHRGNRLKAAERMVDDASKKLVKRGGVVMTHEQKENLNIAIDNLLVTDNQEISLGEQYKETPPLFSPIIPKYGAIELIYDYANAMNANPIPRIAIAAPLSVLSVMIGNKFKLHDNWTNLLITVIAPASFGKNAVKTTITNILDGLGDRSSLLQGASDFASSESFMQGMNKLRARTRVNVCDEYDSLITKMVKGFGTWGALEKNISNSFTASKGKFGSKHASGVASRQTEIRNPCITICGLAATGGSSENITGEGIDAGFYPRTIFLRDNYDSVDFTKRKKLSEITKPKNLQVILDMLAPLNNTDYRFTAECKRVGETETEYQNRINREEIFQDFTNGGVIDLSPKQTDLLGFLPYDLPFSEGVKDLLDELDSYVSKNGRELGKDNPGITSYWGRALEITFKLANIYTFSQQLPLISSAKKITEEILTYKLDFLANTDAFHEEEKRVLTEILATTVIPAGLYDVIAACKPPVHFGEVSATAILWGYWLWASQMADSMPSVTAAGGDEMYNAVQKLIDFVYKKNECTKREIGANRILKNIQIYMRPAVYKEALETGQIEEVILSTGKNGSNGLLKYCTPRRAEELRAVNPQPKNNVMEFPNKIVDINLL